MKLICANIIVILSIMQIELSYDDINEVDESLEIQKINK